MGRTKLSRLRSLSSKPEEQLEIILTDVVLDKLHLLAPQDADDIHRFLSSSSGVEDCVRERVRLMRSHRDLSLSLVCWQSAFKKGCPGYRQDSSAEWRAFEKEMKKNNSCMTCILTTAGFWGDHIVKHYKWRYCHLKFFNQLRCLARKHSYWPGARQRPNVSIIARVSVIDGRKNNTIRPQSSDEHDLYEYSTISYTCWLRCGCVWTCRMREEDAITESAE